MESTRPPSSGIPKPVSRIPAPRPRTTAPSAPAPAAAHAAPAPAPAAPTSLELSGDKFEVKSLTLAAPAHRSDANIRSRLQTTRTSASSASLASSVSSVSSASSALSASSAAPSVAAHSRSETALLPRSKVEAKRGNVAPSAARPLPAVPVPGPTAQVAKCLPPKAPQPASAPVPSVQPAPAVWAYTGPPLDPQAVEQAALSAFLNYFPVAGSQALIWDDTTPLPEITSDTYTYELHCHLEHNLGYLQYFEEEYAKNKDKYGERLLFGDQDDVEMLGLTG